MEDAVESDLSGDFKRMMVSLITVSIYYSVRLYFMCTLISPIVLYVHSYLTHRLHVNLKVQLIWLRLLLMLRYPLAYCD